MHKQLMAKDLDYVFESINPFWEQLRNKHIFITGGTGFYGCLFLESFIWISNKLNLNATITILTRDIAGFKKKFPELCAYSFVNFHSGDIRNFSFPDQKYSYIIHAAADIPSFHKGNSINAVEVIIKGTTQILEFARYCNAENVLFISSVAVYGKPPSELIPLSEESPVSFNLYEPKFSYGIAKYTAEHLCHLYHQSYNINIKIARCSNAIGPYFPLNGHFAMSAFFKSVLEKKPILIQTPVPLYRTYLYAADLLVWLWKIIFCGKSVRPYNVGSEQSISIIELANMMSKICSPSLEVIQKHLWNKNTAPEFLVPDTSRARNELDLFQKTNLTKSIEETLNWYNARFTRLELGVN